MNKFCLYAQPPENSKFTDFDYFGAAVKYYEDQVLSMFKDSKMYLFISEELAFSLENSDSMKNSVVMDFVNFSKSIYPHGKDLLNYVYYETKSTDGKLFFDQHLDATLAETKIKNGELLRGKVFFEPDFPNECTVRCHLFFKKVAIVGSENLNRIIDGDVVAFEILSEDQWRNPVNLLFKEDEDEEVYEKVQDQPEMLNLIEKVEKSEKQPTGRVISILRRQRKLACGSLVNPEDPLLEESLRSQPNLFIPVDKKLPYLIINLLDSSQYLNQRIQVRIDEWPANQIYPSCHFIKHLGETGSIKTENEIILLEKNIEPNQYSKKVIRSLPDENTKLQVTEEDLKRRVDLRGIAVVLK